MAAWQKKLSTFFSKLKKELSIILLLLFFWWGGLLLTYYAAFTTQTSERSEKIKNCFNIAKVFCLFVLL
jgi:hypothetical protein